MSINDGFVNDLAELGSVNISDPKGDGTVALSEGFFVYVQNPGNNSPGAWFTLKNEPSVTSLILHNWAVIASGRTSNEAWISSSNTIVAGQKTKPDFIPSGDYVSLQWVSEWSDPENLAFTWLEKWVFNDIRWQYQPSVIITDPNITSRFPSNNFPTFNPVGQGSLCYKISDGSSEVYIANGDLTGWQLLTDTRGISG